MIFFVGNDGTIVKSDPSPVYQGAAGANDIFIVAPFASNLTASVAFKLPSGVWTSLAAMTSVGEIPQTLNKATNLPYSGWKYSLPNDITKEYGTVTAQFYFYSAQVGRITATSSTSFEVGRGVPAQLPPQPSADIYAQILAALSQLQSDLDNGYFAARSLLAWRDKYTYAANELVWYPTKGDDGMFLKSLTDDNAVPPYNEQGEIDNEHWQEILDFSYIQNLYDLQAAIDRARAAQSAAETAEQGALTAQRGAETAQSGALAAKEAAETAQQGALTAKDEAETALQNAQAAQRGAETARDEAREAAEEAAGKAAEAVTEEIIGYRDEARSAAQQAEEAKNGANLFLADTTREKEAAEAAQQGALAAKTAAETAQEEALKAKDEAQTAQTEAETAKEQAQTAQQGAQAALQSAQTAQQGAETARDQAQSAAAEAAGKAANGVVDELQGLKDAAETAQKNAAKSAQDAATAQAGANAAKDRAVLAQEAVENAESAINTRLNDIEEVIPKSASAENQLVDTAKLNSSLNSFAAFYLAYNAAGDPFPTKKSLNDATTFYYDKAPRNPTRNDYVTVLSDESQKADANGGYPTTRYTYQGGDYPNGQWTLSFIVNNTTFTADQLAALNSGLSKESLEQIETNKQAIADETTRAKAAEAANASAAEAASKAAQNAQNAANAAQQTADNAIPKTEKGAKNGVASLDKDGKVPSTQLPDIPSTLPPTGAAGGDLTGNYPNPEIKAGAVTKAKCDEDVQASLDKADNAVPASTKGQAGGVASLGTDGKVPANQLPATATGDYIPTSEKGEEGGVATLGEDGKVPPTQLPNALPPSGTAGGDLSGTFPNPTIKAGAVTRAKCDSNVQDSLNRADAAMPKGGGTFTGRVSFDSTSLPQDTSPEYYVTVDDYKTGYADTATVKEKLGVNAAQKRADDAYALAGTKYTKPTGGIPASDLAGSIPISKITDLQDTLDDHDTKLDAAANMATVAASLAQTAQNTADAAQNTANNAMPKSGGMFTGRISWNESSLPKQTGAPYFVTIEAFASGGKMYYTSLDDVKRALGLSPLTVNFPNGTVLLATSKDNPGSTIGGSWEDLRREGFIDLTRVEGGATAGNAGPWISSGSSGYPSTFMHAWKKVG